MASASSSAQVQIDEVPLFNQEQSQWTKLEQSFVRERVRMATQLPETMIRAHMRDLIQKAPRHLLANEIATTLYMVVNTPESNSLNALMHLWEALELPIRKEVRQAFEGIFGNSIRAVLGHRLPEHLKSVLSW